MEGGGNTPELWMLMVWLSQLHNSIERNIVSVYEVTRNTVILYIIIFKARKLKIHFSYVKFDFVNTKAVTII